MSDHLTEVARTARAARDAIAARDAAIRTARHAGHRLRPIAAAANMTHPGVKKIIERTTAMTITTEQPQPDLTETARLALVYDEDEGPYRGQLHAVYPWLGTMASTAAWLGTTWHAPEAEDLDDLHLDKTEPSDLLRDAWRMVVQRIADGWTPEN